MQVRERAVSSEVVPVLEVERVFLAPPASKKQPRLPRLTAEVPKLCTAVLQEAPVPPPPPRLSMSDPMKLADSREAGRASVAAGRSGAPERSHAGSWAHEDHRARQV